MKSRGVYETPGGTILYAAHRELESLCLDRDTMHYKEADGRALCRTGLLRQVVPLAARSAAGVHRRKRSKHVTGWVKLKLYKGNVIVAGRYSPNSLYREDFATFGQEDVYDQQDAVGFITLFGLQMKVKAMMEVSRWRQDPLCRTRLFQVQARLAYRRMGPRTGVVRGLAA